MPVCYRAFSHRPPPLTPGPLPPPYEPSQPLETLLTAPQNQGPQDVNPPQEPMLSIPDPSAQDLSPLGTRQPPGPVISPPRSFPLPAASAPLEPSEHRLKPLRSPAARLRAPPPSRFSRVESVFLPPSPAAANEPFLDEVGIMTLAPLADMLNSPQPGATARPAANPLTGPLSPLLPGPGSLSQNGTLTSLLTGPMA
ncbi:pollen-specific leucine-rich repeat extensin-like protein 3, partial [Lontra canadensis]|uniref:pollen-specific leucine-rich repeat extensin-like protein 3 n=1 Tax=Lontra canadensis TaxID=76717 RepID=UPI0013F396F4